MYQDAFINAAANVPGNIVAMLVLDRVGRKATLIASMAGSAACAIGFAFARTQTTVLIASCLLSAVSVGSWNALDALSVESFPSAMRSSAMGTLAAVGRFGSIVGQVIFGLFVADSFAPLLAVTAILLSIGAIAGFFLPFEPAGKALDDGGADGEDELEGEVEDKDEGAAHLLGPVAVAVPTKRTSLSIGRSEGDDVVLLAK